MRRASLICAATLAAAFNLSCSKPTDTRVAPKKQTPGTVTQDVIYGEDDRLDLYEVEDPYWLALADSTVALMSSGDLTTDGEQTNISSDHFGNRYGLCESEPFREQGTAAFCSGFLVAEDIVVTAGHCIRSDWSCQSTRFVFGFAIKEEGQQPTTVPTEDVYSCAELIHSEVDSYGADFAVVRLDRPVTGHEPLQIRQSGEVSPGSGLVVIGHPAGLPTKVAGGAQVRRVDSAYMVANLDTYGGNSGSAVFNSTTGEVEGILVRGALDFVSRNGCRVSNECTDDGCRGEDVTKITEALSYIPESRSSQIDRVSSR